MKPVIGDLLIQVKKDRFQGKGAVFIKGMFDLFPGVMVGIGQFNEFLGLSQGKSIMGIGP